MHNPPGNYSLRRGRVSCEGQIYLITACTWGRANLFANYRIARLVSRVCHAEKTWPDATCLAWVVMPDHWHGLIELHEGDLSKAIRRFKSHVTRAVRATGRRYPVWQKTFHDSALRRDRDVRQAARYLVANPIRAGLVDRVGDYPYWNAVWL
ncbi:REP-associated tyrosine transposase [Luteibacter rhizovicinus]|uniref:REP-associated tyrosine transposase n=1 Tax=Luteibacter rhizovicinus TaxID=242606 RepID=UPI00104B33B4|nr:transposase [Luteibacter rhizovicinus]